MNIFKDIKCALLKILNAEFGKDIINEESITIEYPNNSEYGDLATNIALVAASKIKKKPREIAEILSKKIADLDYVEKIEIAGPGFINLFLKDDFWHQFMAQLPHFGDKYGSNNLGKGQLTNVEFVSANPTGPMHIGHARGAIYGEAIARIMEKSGYDVVREYYINDAGKQIDVLAESLWIRYQQVLGRDVKLADGCYPGEYLIKIAKKIVADKKDTFLEMDIEERQATLRKIALDEMMDLIRSDLDLLGVYHDVFISEQKDIIDKNKLPTAINLLKEKGVLYKGVLDKPKSGPVEDWEPTEQLLLRTTDFGDDLDRPVLRSDGSDTYFSSDIAYHLDKIQRGFLHMVVLLGADHGGYVKRLQAAVFALSDRKATLKVLVNQLINFVKDGKPVKMSKRAGTFLTLREVVDQIGADALRFSILMRKSDTIFDLDFEKVCEQSKDNPLFYIQYAHTRCNSVIKNAHSEGVISLEDLNIEEVENSVKYRCGINTEEVQYSLLKNKAEKNLIKKIAAFPKMVESAAVQYEPHRVGYYLYELANNMHQLWAEGGADSKTRFVIKDLPELTKARLMLIFSTAQTINAGLSLIGVKPMLKM